MFHGLGGPAGCAGVAELVRGRGEIGPGVAVLLEFLIALTGEWIRIGSSVEVILPERPSVGKPTPQRRGSRSSCLTLRVRGSEYWT